MLFHRCLLIYFSIWSCDYIWLIAFTGCMVCGSGNLNGISIQCKVKLCPKLSCLCLETLLPYYRVDKMVTVALYNVSLLAQIFDQICQANDISQLKHLPKIPAGPSMQGKLNNFTSLFGVKKYAVKCKNSNNCHLLLIHKLHYTDGLQGFEC